MTHALALALILLAAQVAPPWRTDAAVARREALQAGKPCVLILQIDARAL